MGRSKTVSLPDNDPLAAAGEAGLEYISDSVPGIRRRAYGKAFRYIDAKGKAVADAASLKRIRALAIPPAWKDVWICPSPYGHLQAVGRDAKGRKQYRYHTAYRHQRDETKYGRMLAFGAFLPAIRRRIRRDLKLPGMSKQKVAATVVQLLESTCMRIGNDEYARENSSYGLTTLKDRHVSITGSRMHFSFKGKSGQQQEVELTDPRLARIVRKCRDIPGWELFQYIDENGERGRVTSTDINEYIREITGEDFTAKDFRTWGGTGWAALIFEELGPAEDETEAKGRIVQAIKFVAEKLGNRPATCRKYYVHPAILDAYADGSLFTALKSCSGVRRQEACVMTVVKRYVRKMADQKDLPGLLRKSLAARKPPRSRA